MRTSCSVGSGLSRRNSSSVVSIPGRAEAALQAMVLVEGLLQRMQLVGARRDAFDGEDLVAVRLHREHQAGARRQPVQEDGAGAAHAVLAAEMGAGQAELVADEVGEGDAHLDLFLVALAVDGQRDRARLAHDFALPIRLAAGRAGVRLFQRASRHHGGEMLAVRRRRVHVVDRLEGAAALAGLAQKRRRPAPCRPAPLPIRARAPAPSPCRRASPPRG